MKKILVLLAVVILILSALYFVKSKDAKKVDIKEVKSEKIEINNEKEVDGEKIEVVKIKTEEVEKSDDLGKKDVVVLENSEVVGDIKIEVSRVRKSCGDKKCLQVKEDGGDWKILKTDISGFEYKDGYYYVLDVVKEKKDGVELYKLVKIEKEIEPKKK